MYFAFISILLINFIFAIEVPPGLRPAKAVDDPEKPIVPKLEEQQEGMAEQHEQPNQEEQEVNKGQISTKFPVRTIPPPAGKDYGVNTLLQTNLVDSKGRVLKGVSSVPILVPDVRNAKASRASASRVESEAEKPVQIKFSG
uniref:Uncharacterized protein n=1 Tax=Meloidogyne hapla TaxID=6305 RepID=A0A1I8B2I1_MELHA